MTNRADPAGHARTEAEGPDCAHWVCLGGGNALGAFHAGVVQAFAEADLVPERLAGTSIGAVTAAIWLGGPVEQAPARLRTFWTRAADRLVIGALRPWRQNAFLRGLLYGRPGLFRPTFPGFLGILHGAPSRDHLFDTTPLRSLLVQLVDFGRVNDAPTRLIVVAHDQTTGQDVIFDNRQTRITLDHLMASSAMPLAFPPVMIDGRPLVDAGVSANLPIDYLVEHAPERPARCWAFDLWPRQGPRAISPDEVFRRTQDLVFAAQRRRATGLAQAILNRHARETGLTVDLHEITYDGAEWEMGGKAFDYTRASLERRWRAGHAAARAALEAPRNG